MPKGKDLQEKSTLHPRNKNRGKYDLHALTNSIPELKSHIISNKYGEKSIDFSNPIAVKTLNRALLSHHYGIKTWMFPNENLCPPIPGRADYIHHMADLLSENNFGKIPIGDDITCLDIGLGASCIYPILGVAEYNWKFIGSDIDPKSIASAKQIINENPKLKDKIECRLQKESSAIFQGVLEKEDLIDVVICNPPFHASIEDAQKGSRRKIKNLSGKTLKIPKLNFSGISKELIYKGGEHQFIQNMINESKIFSNRCFWFSTLVSKQSNLKGIYRSLENSNVTELKTIPFGTGNKSSRIVAWTFLSSAEKNEWRASRWGK